MPQIMPHSLDINVSVAPQHLQKIAQALSGLPIIWPLLSVPFTTTLT